MYVCENCFEFHIPHFYEILENAKKNLAYIVFNIKIQFGYSIGTIKKFINMKTDMKMEMKARSGDLVPSILSGKTFYLYHFLYGIFSVIE